MDRALLQAFIIQSEKLEGKEYLLSKIAYGTAPTIKEIKASSLLSFTTKGRNLYQLWEKLKFEVCRELDLNFFELKHSHEKSVILFYKAHMLNHLLDNEKIRLFLKEAGYDEGLTLVQKLELLKVHYSHGCPHEIGVFLGIPVEDVQGFIRHKGDKSLFCSYWKVYHDPQRAKSLFQGFDNAKMSVINSMIDFDVFRKKPAEAV